MHRWHGALVGGIGGGMVALSLTACSAAPAAKPKPAEPATPASLNQIGTPMDSKIPEWVRDLSFTASAGQRVSLEDLAGRTVVLSDVMTLCQETCPIDTATLVQTARAEQSTSSGRPPLFVSLTVDPARDTTAQLAAYRKLFTRPPSDWQAWTGSAKNVKALWDYFGVWRKRVPDATGSVPHNWRTGAALTYDVQHSDEVFFIDAAGDERFVLEAAPYARAGSVPPKLRSFMDARGRRTLDSPAHTAWTESQAQTVLNWVRR